MRTRQEIIDAFAPNPNLDPSQKAALINMQTSFSDLALEVESNIPECADRTSCLRKLLDAKFTAIQAITHYKATPTEAQDAKTKKNAKNSK